MLELPANRLIISRHDARMRARQCFSRAEYARVEVAQNYYRRVSGAVLIMIPAIARGRPRNLARMRVNISSFAVNCEFIGSPVVFLRFIISVLSSLIRRLNSARFGSNKSCNCNCPSLLDLPRERERERERGGVLAAARRRQSCRCIRLILEGRLTHRSARDSLAAEGRTLAAFSETLPYNG